MSGSIILLSDSEADAKFVSQLARDCGASVKLLRDLNTAISILKSTDNLLAFFIDANSAQFLESFQQAIGTSIARERMHGIVEPHQLFNLEGILKTSLLGSLVIRRYGDPASDGKHYARIVRALMQPEPFGVASLLKVEGEVHKISFSEGVQKGFAAASITSQLQEIGCSERIATTIGGAVDELLMNAMYDAKVDENGAQVYAKTSRDTEMEVSGVELQLAVEGDFIAICVTDSIGSLNPGAIFQHVATSYSSRQNVRDAEFGGAGIGLSLVVRAGGSLLFVTKPQSRTEVTLIFRRTEKLRDFKSQFQFVSSKICATA